MMKRLATTLVTLIALALTAGAVFAAKIDITINKVSQKMIVKVDGATEYEWLVSTGRSGHDTPSGTYRPFRMEEEHFSEEWDNAPMPHSIFFTGEGHAIHGSQWVKSLGQRASHGCVRLAPQNATILYDLVSENGMKNTTISIRGGFFDFGFEDSATSLLSQGFKLGSKPKDKASVKGKKHRFFLFGDL
jgi:lipoprotein-anchoring transpeptidase ErfK/SrfK